MIILSFNRTKWRRQLFSGINKWTWGIENYFSGLAEMLFSFLQSVARRVCQVLILQMLPPWAFTAGCKDRGDAPVRILSRLFLINFASQFVTGLSGQKFSILRLSSGRKSVYKFLHLYMKTMIQKYCTFEVFIYITIYNIYNIHIIYNIYILYFVCFELFQFWGELLKTF